MIRSPQLFNAPTDPRMNIPAGVVVATIRTTADVGWLLLDGGSIANADTLYPALWAAVPASWKSGTSLNLPNMANRMLEGQSTTALGATGGSNTVTIASGNLPTHSHTIDHDHASFTTTAGEGTHSHGVSDPGHTHGPASGDTAFVQQKGYDGTNKAVSVSGTDLSAFNVGSTGSSTTGLSVTSTNSGHTHTIDVPNFTGSSGNGGFANTAMTITNAHLAINFQIKAH